MTETGQCKMTQPTPETLRSKIESINGALNDVPVLLRNALDVVRGCIPHPDGETGAGPQESNMTTELDRTAYLVKESQSLAKELLSLL